MTLLAAPLPIRHNPLQLRRLLQLLRVSRERLHPVAQRWRRFRDAHRLARSLAELDDRTLRDLGLHRSEVSSLTAEVSGLANADRRLALLPPSRGC